MVETTVGKVFGSKNQTYVADLTIKAEKKSRGKIIVRAESLQKSNHEI